MDDISLETFLSWVGVSLQILDISHCIKLTDKALLSVHPELIVLNVSSNSNMTNTGFKLSGSKLLNLDYLIANHCPNLTSIINGFLDPKCLLSIGRSVSVDFHDLDIYDCCQRNLKGINIGFRHKFKI
jgi:hypothetical protein